MKSGANSLILGTDVVRENYSERHAPPKPLEEMVSMSACPTGGDHDWILGDDRKFQCAKCGAQSARRF